MGTGYIIWYDDEYFDSMVRICCCLVITSWAGIVADLQYVDKIIANCGREVIPKLPERM